MQHHSSRHPIPTVPNIKIDKIKAAIQTYGNQKIKPLGKVTLCCERKGKLHLLDFLVVDVPQGKPPLLSGRDAQFLRYLDIHADEIHSLDKVNNSEMMSSTKHQQNQNIPVKGKSPEFSKSPRLGKLTKELVGPRTLQRRIQSGQRKTLRCTNAH